MGNSWYPAQRAIGHTYQSHRSCWLLMPPLAWAPWAQGTSKFKHGSPAICTVKLYQLVTNDLHLSMAGRIEQYGGGWPGPTPTHCTLVLRGSTRVTPSSPLGKVHCNLCFRLQGLCLCFAPLVADLQP